MVTIANIYKQIFYCFCFVFCFFIYKLVISYANSPYIIALKIIYTSLMPMKFCKMFIAFKQGRMVNVLHLLWHRFSVYAVFSLVILYDTQEYWRLYFTSPPPNIVQYKSQPQLWENTQIYNLSLKLPPSNIWVGTQTKNLSTYSNYLKYLCPFHKLVFMHLFDH